MPTVELIYDSDCPNVPQARENLLRAFGQAGLPPRWREWERADAAAPAYVRSWGSPTVLVDGKDVAGASYSDAACCRLYRDDKGARQGAPSATSIAAAFGGTPVTRRYGHGIAPLLPAIGTALMPKLICPACWPAYTGILSALGLGFINYSPLLLPLTAIFLALVLATLAWRASARRGYAPLALGLLASAVILAGKFQFDSDNASYAGIALLIGATLWNAWPLGSRTASCPACTDNLKGGVT